jgi:hypothetical protein
MMIYVNYVKGVTCATYATYVRGVTYAFLVKRKSDVLLELCNPPLSFTLSFAISFF